MSIEAIFCLATGLGAVIGVGLAKDWSIPVRTVLVLAAVGGLVWLFIEMERSL
jgi:hypothetical protein